MCENLTAYERAVLKEFSLLNHFGSIDFDDWIKNIVIINRKITNSGMYLNLKSGNCHDSFNESELVPMDGEVRIKSTDLENGAGFLLYRMKNSNCIYSLEGYSYSNNWLYSESDFIIE